MKQAILPICVCAGLLAGCRTPQKLVSSTTEIAAVNEKQGEAASSGIYAFIDSTKKSEIEISYIKVEFYPPTEPEESDNAQASEQEATAGCAYAGSHTQKPPGGAFLKSIEGYAVKTKREQYGVSENAENTSIATSSERAEQVSAQIEVSEQPASDPYRWRYIFWIIVIVVAVAGYLALRKTGLAGIITSFFSSIFKKI